MLRTTWLFAVLVGVLFAGCSPCARRANAESAADEKGKDCNTGNNGWTQGQVQACEAGLSKCSQDDLKELDAYSTCLDQLAQCTPDHATSWQFSRLECATGHLLNISFTCLNATSK